MSYVDRLLSDVTSGIHQIQSQDCLAKEEAHQLLLKSHHHRRSTVSIGADKQQCKGSHLSATACVPSIWVVRVSQHHVFVLYCSTGTAECADSEGRLRVTLLSRKIPELISV
jgi:hypothetical protein